MHDPILIPWISASDDDSRRQELEVLIVEHAAPTIQGVIRRFARNDRTVGREENEEVAATVTLRLLRKLQSSDSLADDVIRNFESYVATLTYRTIYDVLRERFPERTRLKNRIRYLLNHDARFALWPTDDGMVCGLAAWKGRSDALPAFELRQSAITATMRDAQQPGRVVQTIFERAGKPLELDALVTVVADLWNVAEARLQTPDVEVGDPLPTHAARYEERQFVETLWNEIRELPPRQRAALLLNLRDPSGVNAVALFVVLGVGRFDDIAASIGMSPAELAAIWESLPLDDLAIAERLGITRQQVINLRRSARERLARRTLPGRSGKRR